MRATIVKVAAAAAFFLLLPVATGSDARAAGQAARVDGVVAGAPFSLFRPDDWNGGLVLLVHGSTANEFEILADELTAQGFGVAFATLAPGLGEGSALRAITLNTRQVQARFAAEFGLPDKTYLVGFSRGGHNMTRLLETTPERYDGMLSVCAANGGAQLAWDYFFTARVLFDHYFTGVLPGSALAMPPLDLNEFFLGDAASRVISAILLNPAAAVEMASVNQYALEHADFGELVTGILQSLAIHSIGVNDLLLAAHGNPFDNLLIEYTGTGDDPGLNAGVQRLQADPQARQYLRTWYEPDGRIVRTPVLLLHTSRDPITPEMPNNDKYQALVEGTGNGDALVRRVVDRFGHCNFRPEEIVSSFKDLVAWSEGGIKPVP